MVWIVSCGSNSSPSTTFPFSLQFLTVLSSCSNVLILIIAKSWVGTSIMSLECITYATLGNDALIGGMKISSLFSSFPFRLTNLFSHLISIILLQSHFLGLKSSLNLWFAVFNLIELILSRFLEIWSYWKKVYAFKNIWSSFCGFRNYRFSQYHVF